MTLDVCRYLAYTAGGLTTLVMLVFAWLVVEAVNFAAIVQLRKMEADLYRHNSVNQEAGDDSERDRVVEGVVPKMI